MVSDDLFQIRESIRFCRVSEDRLFAATDLQVTVRIGIRCRCQRLHVQRNQSNFDSEQCEARESFVCF